MTRSLKLLACMLYVTFATAACHPNVKTHDDADSSPKEEQKVKIVSVGDVPNTAYRLVEYEVLYDTNRIVNCLALKSPTEYVKQTSLICDWERSRWDGIH